MQASFFAVETVFFHNVVCNESESFEEVMFVVSLYVALRSR